jgi:hypothetical protein
MRLYHVIRSMSETLFLSDSTGDALKREAESFLAQEHRNKSDIKILEIVSEDQIPSSWSKNALLWNVEEEITAQDFLKERSVEYKEYLRLKAKYG